jgi:hypothetical protein
MAVTVSYRNTEVGYANECDRLSELSAVKIGKPHWGRWVLNKTKHLITLDCIQVRPSVGSGSQRTIQSYWIELSRIGPNGESDGGTYTWQEHLSEKNWMGEKGLADFMRAVNELYAEHSEWFRVKR